jgi:hypothetical protein
MTKKQTLTPEDIKETLGTIAIIVVVMGGLILSLLFIVNRLDSSIEQTTTKQTTTKQVTENIHPSGPPKFKFGDRVLYKGFLECIVVSDPIHKFGDGQWQYYLIDKLHVKEGLYNASFSLIDENLLQHKYQILPEPQNNDFQQNLGVKNDTGNVWPQTEW